MLNLHVFIKVFVVFVQLILFLQFGHRFVGMLPREQLQKYLVRAITGTGERVQGQDISQQALEQTGEQVASLAGACVFLFLNGAFFISFVL